MEKQERKDGETARERDRKREIARKDRDGGEMKTDSKKETHGEVKERERPVGEKQRESCKKQT